MRAYNLLGGVAHEASELTPNGSPYRVAIGGSYLVDYNGPRPDSMTEDAMARILDAPLAAPGSAGANGGMRWRRTSQQQLAQQEAAASGAAEAGAAAAIASERNHTPSDQQPCCSAPASVGSDGSPGEGTGAGAGWASGSLSLPESTRTTPLAAQRTRDWGLPGALGDLPKEQLAARWVALATSRRAVPGACIKACCTLQQPSTQFLLRPLHLQAEPWGRRTARVSAALPAQQGGGGAQGAQPAGRRCCGPAHGGPAAHAGLHAGSRLAGASRWAAQRQRVADGARHQHLSPPGAS